MPQGKFSVYRAVGGLLMSCSLRCAPARYRYRYRYRYHYVLDEFGELAEPNYKDFLVPR